MFSGRNIPIHIPQVTWPVCLYLKIDSSVDYGNNKALPWLSSQARLCSGPTISPTSVSRLITNLRFPKLLMVRHTTWPMMNCDPPTGLLKLLYSFRQKSEQQTQIDIKMCENRGRNINLDQTEIIHKGTLSRESRFNVTTHELNKLLMTYLVYCMKHGSKEIPLLMCWRGMTLLGWLLMKLLKDSEK